MQVKIRPIQKADNAKVAAIIRQVMTEFSCVGEGYSISDPEVDDMYNASAEDNAAFFIIESQEEILGCGGFGPLVGGDGNVCELKKMYFLSSLRGMGMGKKLLNLCIDEARKAGYRTMYLETVARMKAANGLYQKRGFKQSPESMGATGHGSCDAFYSLQL